MNLCGKLLTEREGKSIGLAFFLVVAIKSNLSTIEAAKIHLFSETATGKPKIPVLVMSAKQRKATLGPPFVIVFVIPISL